MCHAREAIRNYPSDTWYYLGITNTNISEATKIIVSTTNSAAIFTLEGIDNKYKIYSNQNIIFDLEANANVQFATYLQFYPSATGRKIDYYDNIYRTDIEAYTLVQVSDRDFKWQDDEDNVLMNLTNASGLSTTNDIISGDEVKATSTYGFTADSTGDKIYLYNNLYKLSISAGDLDVYTDANIKMHSDTLNDAFIFNCDNGFLTTKGNISVSDNTVEDATSVEAAKFNFRQKWVEPDAATLKSKLNDGDMVLGEISSALYIFILSDGILEHYNLVIESSWDPTKYYLPIKVDDEIYGLHINYVG